MIKSIMKPNLKYLNDVFTYRNRTVAIRFIITIEELDMQWEKFQLELASAYQYESENKNVWDYYLVFLCAFDEKSFDSRIRFKIENNRFCCRKIFIFSFTKKEYTKPDAVCQILFPEIEKTKPIQVIQPQSLIKKLKSNLKDALSEDFFTKELDSKQIDSVLKRLIKNGEKNG